MDCGGAPSVIIAFKYGTYFAGVRVTHRWRPWVGIVWRWGTVLLGAGGGVLLVFTLAPVICRKPTHRQVRRAVGLHRRGNVTGGRRAAAHPAPGVSSLAPRSRQRPC